MRISDVARKYAKALYDATKVSKKNESVLSELRQLRDIFHSDKAIIEFFSSPLNKAEQTVKVVKSAFEGKVSAEVLTLLVAMVERGRLPIFEQVADAFEEISDLDHGVKRGTVKSVSSLNPEARQKIEDTVNRVTGMKVILNFTEDPSLLGGMVAQVGGWTFDDSLSSHLRRMHEELNRRAN
jgi:F-type H+-transporting ATPase subunit delta